MFSTIHCGFYNVNVLVITTILLHHFAKISKALLTKSCILSSENLSRLLPYLVYFVTFDVILDLLVFSGKVEHRM